MKLLETSVTFITISHSLSNIFMATYLEQTNSISVEKLAKNTIQKCE